MICLIDYGVGNLASIVNMYKHIGIKDVVISSSETEIFNASRIILPGVGAFDKGMNQLESSGLIDVLNHKALVKKVPVLGICLGMQLMTKGSEEGTKSGLGWFDAYTYKFKKRDGLKIPHMGWNYIKPIHDRSNFLVAEKRYRFYFVHSYHVKCENNREVMFKTDYAGEFDSGIHNDNIYGMQFHPEKSLHFGMDILKRFSEI
jgi:imidazole glycerol-phosphate synthase subunit HisH